MFDPASKVVWSCDRCREGGTLPVLDGAQITELRDAIARGHERRCRDCHDRHGTRHVRVVHDGKTLRFGAFTAPLPPKKLTLTGEVDL